MVIDPEESAELASAALGECMDALALVASPRAFERAHQKMGRDGVHRYVDERIRRALDWIEAHAEAGGEVDERLVEQALPLLERLRGMVRTWPFGTSPPRALVECSRAALLALGMPPPDSWDSFEPPQPDHEAD